ncbi:kynurenine aminotransferase-like [Planococcus citri]|uniref:kynurenine aminotransferase-like n=1 Tax=Planococcus citri TaxID=170843 RepID=UPI0031F9D466
MNAEVERIKKKFTLPHSLQSSEYNVWVDFSIVAAQYKPVDLGQGCPNYLPGAFIVDTLTDVSESMDSAILHETRGAGHLRLVNALSNLYSRFCNRKIDPEREVMITCGAYEALYGSIVGNVEVGDEVIIIEPFFDCYEPLVQLCGGKIRFIPLRNTSKNGLSSSSSDWKLDEDELRGLFNEKTKLIILNSPMNPIGKVFSRKELTFIAELCIKYNVMVISDEVYEWLVYEPTQHVRMASLPGMFERTITIGSSGKAFCVTGWKCGWAYGSAQLIANAQVVHSINTNSYITPIQEAVALCVEREIARFDSPECWFKVLPKDVKPKRDYFIKALIEAGFKPICPEGGFFIVADWSALESKTDLRNETSEFKDINMAKWMVKNINLLAIPPSVFYSANSKHLGLNLIRFCFFKTDETLSAAVECLQKLKNF